MRIPIGDDTRVLVLTGAGVSQESGIPTFRDANGLWENHAVEEVASPQGFEADPKLVWRFYGQRRAAASLCAPNPGHLALAALEQRLGDRFLLATQNVDGLHARAGNGRLIELHGNLFRTRCSRCTREPFEDLDTYDDGDRLPGCSRCNATGHFALLRPHIVWFGEMLDPRDLLRVAQFLDATPYGKLVFLAVGTSGLVWPAAGMVDQALQRGAATWLVNADPPANRDRFDHYVEGPSGRLLPELLAG